MSSMMLIVSLIFKVLLRTGWPKKLYISEKCLAGGLRTGVDVATSIGANENTITIASSLSFFDPVYVCFT